MIHIGAIERLERDTKRVAEIVGVLTKFGLADWLRAIPLARVKVWLQSPDGDAISDLTFNERIRSALVELGTTFIKLGQMLSTRPDLIGSELAEELGHLQKNTTPDSEAVIRRLFGEEFGKSPEELFACFEIEAFASASIAQVHKAQLPSGENVVAKIQKTGIQKQIESDLSILSGLAELAEKYASQVRPYEPVAVVKQFRKTILRELNFNEERRNIEEFTKNFAGDPTVKFPQAWPEYSSRRVLTMEFLGGISGSEPERMRETGIDLNEFARKGANMYLEMIFRDSFYHADPHPGNLMLLPGGVVGVLDCGMAGRLDEGTREDVETLLLAVAQRDAETLTDSVLSLGGDKISDARDQLRLDLSEFVTEFAGQAISELEIGTALNSLADIIRRNQITLPPAVSLLLRTLVLLEGTAKQLSPDFSLAEVIQPFYQRSIGRRFSPQRIMLRLQRSYRDWDRLFRSLPRDLSETIQRIRTGRLTVHLDHRHLDPVINRLVMGVLTASLFLGSSLLWAMKAPPLLNEISIVGSVGYVASAVLIWRLIRAIKRSGNVDSKDE